MKNNKTQNIILIFLGLIIIIIIIMITYINSQSAQRTKDAVKSRAQQTPVPPARIPTRTPYRPVTSIPTLPMTNPAVIYDISAERLFMDKVKNRKPLDPIIKEAKTTMLVDLLPEDAASGTIYTSPQIRIEYNFTMDVFEIEIRTTDTDSAKKEAVDWFIAHGFTEQAVCDHPVEFYLNRRISEQLRSSNITFSTLPPNCQ